MIYLYLGGLCLAAVCFVRFFFTRNKPHSASAFALVVMLSILAWQYGFAIGARIHLLVNERRYYEKIRELSRAASEEERDRLCGDTCMPHPNDLVVFHYCHCFQSWPDIVYDPHNVLNASDDELQKISIYLHGSRRLSKFWYIGYFGD